MNKQSLGMLLVTSLLFSQTSVQAETPFTGNHVEVTNDAGTVMINGVAVPANAGSGGETSAKRYTITSGDTLSDIAAKFLGSSNRYMEIVNLNAGRYPSLRNNPNLIYPGWTLTLPSGAQPVSNPSSSATRYTIKSGDTLSAIAAKFLGSSNRYMELVNLNASRYPSLRSNPNLIHPGWTLTLPSGAQPGTSSPSTNHATTPPASSGESAALNAWQGGRLSPSAFCSMLGPVAAASFAATGVPASVSIAQAALETGWGASTIGSAKNLFGIKGTGPAGSVTVPTQEWENGRYVTVNGTFRKYNTWQESIDDHARLISTVSRYQGCMQYKNDPDQFARAVHRAGYATDPEYANKLISIMKANNLYQYDK